jgi:hypothetical protein
MGGLLFGFESKGDGWMGIQDMSHVIGKSKAELLAMARTHQEGKKGMLLVVYSILPLLQITDWRDSLLGDEVQAFELFFDQTEWKGSYLYREICHVLNNCASAVKIW